MRLVELGDGGFFGTVRTGDVDYFNALSWRAGCGGRERRQREREAAEEMERDWVWLSVVDLGWNQGRRRRKGKETRESRESSGGDVDSGCLPDAASLAGGVLWLSNQSCLCSCTASSFLNMLRC